MSTQENAQLVENFFQLFLADDISTMLDLQTDDIEWKVAPGAAEKFVPYFGTYRGREEAMQCLSKIEEAVETQEFEIREYLADGDKVIAIGYEKAIAKPTGKPFELGLFYIFTIREGKIASLLLSCDTAMVMEAFRET